MKFTKTLAIAMALLLILTGCTAKPTQPQLDATDIQLSDEKITVDGNTATSDTQSAVYVANDIVYYEAGKDFTYGEGEAEDAHTPEDAAEHTVVHITKPGNYALSGKLSKGQIAVDLGEDAEEDPEAVVTLILNGLDITCEVAPAVIFYHVYECGDTENPTKDADTAAAGANVIIADGSENTVNGSYVARIYKPDSVVLSEDGTAVEDAKKLHKYDAAFYSKMSMNVYGGKENTGTLNIHAENEGLDSELHLTLNGGNINICSGNDGINTNEDGVSVTRVNGGVLNIQVTGETGEGDGIDSNGWLVINGGTVIAAACSNSGDSGIDSDMGIHINGGTVIATGNMLDRIEDGGQTHAVFNFAQKQKGNVQIVLKDSNGNTVFEHTPQNDYSILIYSSPDLNERTYTLFSGDKQMTGQTGGMGGRPEGMTPPDGAEQKFPEGTEIDKKEPPEGVTPAEGNALPEGFKPPEGMENPPEKPDKPDGQEQRPQGVEKPNGNKENTGEYSTAFVISKGSNMFNGITIAS